MNVADRRHVLLYAVYRTPMLRQGRRVVLAVFFALVAFAGWAASAQAGSGWYLLVPPRSAYDKKAPFLQGIKILTDSPLSKWSHASSHESADDCETSKSIRVVTEHSVFDKSSQEYIRLVGEKGIDEFIVAHQRYLTELNNANVDALNAARCIASDDARLR